MSDLEAAYRSRIAAEEESRLRQGLDQALADEQTTARTPAPANAAGPLGPPAPKKQDTGEFPGLATAGSMAIEGIKNFGQGIANAIVPPTPPETILGSAGTRAMGVGQSGLGVLQILMALPAGVGADVRKAMETYTPGMESAVAIKEGSTAGKLRAILSAPSLLFDPKMKEAIEKNPQAVLESLDAPVTFGELIDLAAQFAVGGVIGKGLKAGKVKVPDAIIDAPTPKAPLALSPAPTPKALPPAPYEFGPSPLAVSLTDRLKSDFAMGRRHPAAEAVIMQSIERRRATGQRDLRSEAPLELPGPEATQGAVLDAAGRPVSAPPETPISRADLRARHRTPLDAPQRAAEAVPEDVMPSGELVQTLDLASRRAEQAIREELDKAGAKLREALEKAPEEPTKPDVPKATPARIVEPPTEAEKAALPAEQAEVIQELKALREKLGEKGAISANLAPILARVAIGAAVGGTQGETVEERLANAFLGAGLGAALSRRLAVRVSEAYKSSRLADEKGAIDLRRFTRKAQAEVPFEPNFRRIETTPEATRYIKNLYDVIKTDIAEQGRGIQPHRQMDAAAKTLLKDGTMTPDRILGFRPGTILNDAELKAARHIEIRAAEEASRLMDQRDAGVAVDPTEIARSIAVSGALSINVRSAIKETGRALSSLRAAASSRNTAATVVHSERIELVAERMRAGATIDEIIDMWRSLKTVENQSTFARLSYAIPEALLEAAYGAMLSGGALVKNAVSNFLVMPLAAVERSVAAYMPRNIAGLVKGDPRAIRPSEGPMGFVAIWEGTLEQLRMLRHFDEIRAQSERMGTTKVEVDLRGFEALGEIARDRGFTNLGKAMDWLHTGFSVGPNIMRATDGMAKAANGRLRIQWEAMRQATLEGKDGPSYWQRVNALKDDYTQLSPDAHQRIAEFRENQTFTKDLEGRLSGAIQAGPSNPWLNLAYRLTLATFVRTPVRLAEYAMERTPGLNLLAKHFWQEHLAGGERRSVAEARLATGAAIMGGFAYLTMQGLITPPEPDWKKRQALIAAGLPPASWWDPVNGTYRTYEGLEPVSTLLGTSATLVNYMRQLPEADGDMLFLAAVLSQVDALNAKSYTQAISEFIELLANPRSAGRVEAGLDYIRKKLTVFAPAAFREIERLGDPEERRATPSGAFDDRTPGGALRREWHALLDEYRSRLPGLSSATDEQGRSLVPAERNMFTGEVLLNATWPFNPWRARAGNDAPWAVEIQRLKGAGLVPIDEWIGRRAGSDIGMTDKPTAPGLRLDPWELDRLKVLMTQTPLAGKTLTQALTELVESDVYQQQSDLTKKTWIQSEWAIYRQHAETTLLKENDTLRGAYLARQGKAMIERLPPARQPEMVDRLQQVLRTLGR